MRFVSLLIEPLWRSGSQGKLLVGLLALLIVVAIVSLVISLFPRSAMVTRHFLWFVALVALGAFSATRNLVATSRTAIVASTLPGGSEPALTPLVAAERASNAISSSYLGMMVAGIAFTVSALVAIAPLWRSDLRRASRLAASAACGLVALASAFVVTYVEKSRVPFHYCEGQSAARCRFEHIETTRAVTDAGSTVLLAFGAAALIVAVFFALRSEPETPHNGMGLFSAGVVVLALGGSAFAATRGMERDAHGPLSVPAEEANCLAWWSNLPPPLPRARAQCETAEAPIVVCTASGLSIDGVSVNHAELEKVLRVKRELWMHLNPRRPFPGRVIVLAREVFSRPSFVPALTAAKSAGYPHIGVLAEVPQPGVATATLGVVPRNGRCCATFFELDPGGRPIESFSTWGALHEAAARETKLTVRLR